MRIGIDAHVLGKRAGGVERFLSNLVTLLPEVMQEHQLIIFVDAAASKSFSFCDAVNVKIVPMRISNPLIARSILLPWLAYRYKLDTLLVQRLLPYFCGRCRLVVTVHDITPIKYPENYRGVTNMLVRWLTGDSLRRANLILTPTQVIADEVSVRFDIPLSKIIPFYNGVDPRLFHPAKARASSPYIFTSGAIEARRNIETIFRARALLGERLPWQIWIAGGVRDYQYYEGLKTLADKLKISEHVRWLGFVEESHLIELYQGARVFVTASRDEGFNIPPLEAMACGVPVLCSDIPVHRELFSGAALFYPTERCEMLAEALLRLDCDIALNEELREGAQACVGRLGWNAMAQRIGAALAALE